MNDESYWPHVKQAYDAVSIYDGPEVFHDGLRQFPAWVGDLLAAHWLLSEVSNGGFTQFFLNSTGVLAPEAATAFHRMGLPAVGSLVDRAITTFGSEYPRTEDARAAHLSESDTFKDIETELYQHGSPNLGKIYDVMDTYARANAF